MELLLDTQAFLWFTLQDQRLSQRAREAIEAADSLLMISPVCFWEIAIKVKLGKLAVPEPFRDFIDRELTANDILVLPITVERAAVMLDLPFHHRDPFDRMLAAQALTEDWPVVSSDDILDAYGLTRIW